MSRYKRKIEDFDPNQSDSDDLDYGQQKSSPARPQRPKSRKPKGPPAKKRAKRQRYGDSEDDIEIDSAASSDAEESYPEEVEEVERNPRTGRGVRSVAKKAVKYEEPSEDDIESAGSPDSTASPVKRSKRDPSPKQLIVKLRVPTYFANMPPADEHTTRSTRSRTGSKSTNMRASTPNVPSGLGTRRSSRISHTDEAPLQSLPTSGNRGLRSRRGTATPEPEPTASKRPSRGGKALPNMPSAILEESQEFSQEVSQPHGQAQLISQLQIAAAQDGGEATPGYTSVEAQEDDEIQMEQVVEESQEDEDDAPVARTNTRLRTRRQASTPAPAQETSASTRPRRGLKPRSKPEGEISDFEPDAEGEDEADVAISSGEDSVPQTQSDSRTRRSGRNKAKTGSKSRRQSSESEAALDSDEIADEAADLEDDEKRKKRENRRKKPSSDIRYEARKQLRARKEKVDYRMKTLAEVNNNDDLALEDTGDYQLLGSQQAAAPKARKPRADKDGYRSLFSTTGPFGGFSGPKPVLGGPSKHEMAGGADSDSSDDERAMAGMGGAAGMTPIKPMQPQSALTGPGGGPPDLGRVKDKQALADADPLGVDPNINFDSVGGLGGHIERLKEMCMLPLLYPEIYSRFHVTPPRGVLFHGPPGTGKTMLARALASSVGSHGKKVTFYVRKGADALSKWVGEAEKQLRLLFEEARKNQPSIIFFDEIDGLAPVRSSKQDQIHASIVSTLLALMDGMDGRGQVIVIGATNRPDSVDPALRRPGRFDREFYFPLPNQEARRAILDIHTKGWNPPLADEFKDKLAEQTKGYGGADLRALCTEAALNAVQGTFPQIYASDKKLIIDPSQIKVLAKDFMLSVDKIVPSSERSAASGAVPLKKDIEPLLRKPLREITAAIDKAIPRKRKATALEEAMYDDRDDEYGFERENMQRQFESARIFRPRLLIKGLQGMGQNYLGGAVLSKLEGLHVQNMGLSVLMSDTTRVSSSLTCTCEKDYTNDHLVTRSSYYPAVRRGQTPQAQHHLHS
jgi:AAA+ superfamily predicted ATPase